MTAPASGGGRGPLQGLRVLEFAGLGPAPFAAMLFADLGADVVRVDRMGAGNPLGPAAAADVLNRGRRSIVVDAKTPDGQDVLRSLIERSDVLIEGFRPGVMERLGVGPDAALAINPRLVYGRMTGWGQEGPLAQRAGHDINYIALTGALWATGRAPDAPVPPLNLVGDFGGGAMFLAFGVMCAIFESQRSGQGQVVDAAMVDGTAVLSSLIWSMKAQGLWGTERSANPLDGAAPFYDVYACADGAFIAVGAIEPQFYAQLVARTGFATQNQGQYDRSTWPEQKQRWADLFASQPRAYWVELLADSDCCVAPVLSWEESLEHPHLQARGTYLHDAHDPSCVTQPAPAPRFSRTSAATPAPPPATGAHTDAILSELGYPADMISALHLQGVVQ